MKVLIVGSGISGRSAYDYLKSKNYDCSFASQKDIEAKDFESWYLDRLFEGLSFIVTSPGISPKIELIRNAKKRRIKVICEYELGLKELKGDVVAITGTNGKTTTVSLINHMLKNYDKGDVFFGGNVGVPITRFASRTQKHDISVIETSSFQLEWAKQINVHIAAILNITEDHLNRHKTMKNYIACKQKITKSQTEKDYLILNADDDLLMQNIPKTRAQIYYFSTKKKVRGCYVKNGNIYFNDNLFETKIGSVKKIKLIGEHNLSNVLCGVLAVYLQTQNLEYIKNIETFEGVEHRIEFVKNVGDVEFFNDSKATNIDSTIVALKSFRCGINLILGGSDKGANFDELFKNLPQNIKNIAIFGETKHKIAFSAEKYGFKNYYLCDSLKASTLLCYELANPKEIVLLSPACASFDCFSNYEERGLFFKKVVAEIADNENEFISSK